MTDNYAPVLREELDMTKNPPSIGTIADDLMLANDVDVEHHGYGKPEKDVRDRAYIPIEEYGEKASDGIVARYRVYIDIEQID